MRTTPRLAVHAWWSTASTSSGAVASSNGGGHWSGQQIGAGVGFIAGFFLPVVESGRPWAASSAATSRRRCSRPEHRRRPDTDLADGHADPEGVRAPAALRIDRDRRRQGRPQDQEDPVQRQGRADPRPNPRVSSPRARSWRARGDRGLRPDLPEREAGLLDHRRRQHRCRFRQFAAQLRLYYGTRDQDADPSLEAMHGVGILPAIRGVPISWSSTTTRRRPKVRQNRYRVEVIAAGEQTTTCYPQWIATDRLGNFQTSNGTDWLTNEAFSASATGKFMRYNNGVLLLSNSLSCKYSTNRGQTWADTSIPSGRPAAATAQ